MITYMQCEERGSAKWQLMTRIWILYLQGISTINTVICTLVGFHRAVKRADWVTVTCLFPWRGLQCAGGCGGGWVEEDERVWGWRSQGSRDGGFDGNVETGVINLQMGGGVLGSGVSVSCLSMLGCFVMAPSSSSPRAPGAILHSYLWASTRPLNSAVPPLYWSFKVDKEVSCCRWAVCTNSYKRSAWCVCAETLAASDSISICPFKEGGIPLSIHAAKTPGCHTQSCCWTTSGQGFLVGITPCYST